MSTSTSSIDELFDKMEFTDPEIDLLVEHFRTEAVKWTKKDEDRSPGIDVEI